jgi:hypothetical protein
MLVRNTPAGLNTVSRLITRATGTATGFFNRFAVEAERFMRFTAPILPAAAVLLIVFAQRLMEHFIAAQVAARDLND